VSCSGYKNKLRFGVVFYTSHNGSQTGTCPILSEVRPATNNYEGIRTLYNRMDPDDDTPTGDAIDKVVEEINEQSTQGPQSILLVTDGDPDSCARPDPQDGQPEAILAAQHAYSEGIDLFILGISADIAATKVQQIANAGKGKPIDALWSGGASSNAAQPFHASESVAGLTDQLLDILARVRFAKFA